MLNLIFGRTGVLSPLAIIEPISLAGSIISKTSLHNVDYIKEKDLKIGDKVLVQKAGDIIPEIIKAVKDKRDGSEKDIIVPTTCPSCNSKLIKIEGEVAIRCMNIDCPAKLRRAIEYFASRDCMNILGLR